MFPWSEDDDWKRSDLPKQQSGYERAAILRAVAALLDIRGNDVIAGTPERIVLALKLLKDLT